MASIDLASNRRQLRPSNPRAGMRIATPSRALRLLLWIQDGAPPLSTAMRMDGTSFGRLIDGGRAAPTTSLRTAGPWCRIPPRGRGILSSSRIVLAIAASSRDTARPTAGTRSPVSVVDRSGTGLGAAPILLRHPQRLCQLAGPTLAIVKCRSCVSATTTFDNGETAAASGRVASGRSGAAGKVTGALLRRTASPAAARALRSTVLTMMTEAAVTTALLCLLLRMRGRLLLLFRG